MDSEHATVNTATGDGADGVDRGADPTVNAGTGDGADGAERGADPVVNAGTGDEADGAERGADATAEKNVDTMEQPPVKTGIAAGGDAAASSKKRSAADLYDSDYCYDDDFEVSPKNPIHLVCLLCKVCID